MNLKLEVGEPRSFKAADNTSVIDAEVAEGLEGSRTVGENTEYWFVVTCRPQTEEGVTFTSLLIVPRYRTKKRPIELFAAGEELVCNCIFTKDGKPWDNASVSSAVEGDLEVGGVLVAKVKKA